MRGRVALSLCWVCGIGMRCCVLLGLDELIATLETGLLLLQHFLLYSQTTSTALYISSVLLHNSLALLYDHSDSPLFLFDVSSAGG